MAEQTVTGVTYHGATESELRDLSAGEKLLGWFVQQRLFPHHGILRLEHDRLVLESWMEIPRTTVERVSLEFTEVYGRFMAAGTRGNVPSFGWIGDLGKPLILYRMGGDESIYLQIDFKWLMGTNKNRNWYERLDDWISPATDTAGSDRG